MCAIPPPGLFSPGAVNSTSPFDVGHPDPLESWCASGTAADLSLFSPFDSDNPENIPALLEQVRLLRFTSWLATEQQAALLCHAYRIAATPERKVQAATLLGKVLNGVEWFGEAGSAAGGEEYLGNERFKAGARAAVAASTAWQPADPSVWLEGAMALWLMDRAAAEWLAGEAMVAMAALEQNMEAPADAVRLSRAYDRLLVWRRLAVESEDRFADAALVGAARWYEQPTEPPTWDVTAVLYHWFEDSEMFDPFDVAASAHWHGAECLAARVDPTPSAWHHYKTRLICEQAQWYAANAAMAGQQWDTARAAIDQWVTDYPERAQANSAVQLRAFCVLLAWQDEVLPPEGKTGLWDAAAQLSGAVLPQLAEQRKLPIVMALPLMRGVLQQFTARAASDPLAVRVALAESVAPWLDYLETVRSSALRSTEVKDPIKGARQSLELVYGALQDMQALVEVMRTKQPGWYYGADGYVAGRRLATAMIGLTLDLQSLADLHATDPKRQPEAYLRVGTDALDRLFGLVLAQADEKSTLTDEGQAVDAPPPADHPQYLASPELRGLSATLLGVWGETFSQDQARMRAARELLLKDSGPKKRLSYEPGQPIATHMINFVLSAVSAEDLQRRAQRTFAELSAPELTAVIDLSSNYMEYLVDYVKARSVGSDTSREAVLTSARIAGYKLLAGYGSMELIRRYPTAWLGMTEVARAVYNKAKGEGNFEKALEVGRVVHRYVTTSAQADGNCRTECLALEDRANVNRMLLWNLLETARVMAKPLPGQSNDAQKIRGAQALVEEAHGVAEETVNLQEEEIFGRRDLGYARNKIARFLHNYAEQRRIWRMAELYGSDELAAQAKVCVDYRTLGPDDPRSTVLYQEAVAASTAVNAIEQRLGQIRKVQANDYLAWGMFAEAITAYGVAMSPDGWPGGAVQEKADTAVVLAVALVGKLCTEQPSPDIQCTLAREIRQTRDIASAIWSPLRTKQDLAAADRGIAYYCNGEIPAPGAAVTPPKVPAQK